MTVNELFERVETCKANSAWSRGVKLYATDFLFENLYGHYSEDEQIENVNLLEKALLNGASDWLQYSYGGCAYIYDSDIAKTLCTKTELKRTDNGRLAPNRRETWLDTQARALKQACMLIKNCYKYPNKVRV